MKKTVLIADDDPLSLKLVRDVCTIAGYDVLTATNGQQAVELAKAHKPGLILLDIMMPVMDGYAAMSILKTTPETKDIPVIILTAVAFEQNREQALKAGANDYITKPINIKQLLSRIGQYFSPGGVK